jgi:hypothetical protein
MQRLQPVANKVFRGEYQMPQGGALGLRGLFFRIYRTELHDFSGAFSRGCTSGSALVAAV